MSANITARLLPAARQLLLAMALAAPAHGQNTSLARTDYVVSQYPTFVATADFNQDGKIDLALPRDPSNVYILLGNGDGTFGAPAGFATNWGPVSVATADINRDGKIDLALANRDSNTVSILIGAGDGTFSTRSDFATESHPVAVTVEDFNRDGKPDVAVVNNYSACVSILLGDGAGGLGARTNFPTGPSPYSVASGDVDRDGRADLLVANEYSDSVSVLIGNGDGTFDPRTDFPSGRGPRSVAVADFDRDGHLDVVTANITTHNVSILLGNGDGSFGPKTDFAAGSAPVSITAGDFNLDGGLDIAVVNMSSNSISIFPGDGAGGFGPRTDFSSGTMPISVGTADFDADGDLDLATANRNTNTTSVFLNTTTVQSAGGAFNRTEVLHNSRTQSLLSADLDRDGMADLIGVSDLYGVGVMRSNGDGTFGAMTTSPLAGAPSPNSAAFGDLNRDGNLDLVTAQRTSSSSISLFFGAGLGGFSPRVDIVTGRLHTSMALGDFDGDGDLDIATVDGGGNAVSVLFGDGAGAFSPITDYALWCPWSVASGDVNRDGLPDLVVGTGCGIYHVKVLLGTGGGAFGAPTGLPVGNEPRAIRVADFNRDGSLDVMTVAYNSSSVSVLLGNGNGSFAPKTDFATAGHPNSIQTGDFNRDGRLDVAVSCETSGVSLLLGNGDGTFMPKADFSAGFYPSAVTAGDFNRDGKLDFAAGDGEWDFGGISLLLNSPQEPPVAAAGPDQTVELGALVILDGSGSTDPNGDALTYEWTNAAGAVVATTATVSLPGLPLGTHAFTLTVEDAFGGSDSDVVEVTIMDTTVPTVAVVAPNGGEKLFNGSPVLVGWTASDNGVLGSFDVLVSVDGGATFVVLPGCSGLSGAARSCTWASPGPATTQGLIRIVATDASGNTSADQSDSTFSIVPGTGYINVTAPNTALDWAIGSTQQIKWSHNLGINAFVRIEISRDGRDTWEVIAPSFRNTGAASSTFNWVVTGPPVTRAARVRLSWLSGLVSDISNADFTISPPFIVLAGPATTSTQLGYGTRYQQKWTTNLSTTARVNVLLSTDGGETFPTTLADNVLATKKMVTLTLPELPAETAAARIRVQSVSDAAIHGTSPVDISVAPASVRLTFPNSATDVWTIGSSQAVTWSGNLGTLENVKVELSLDGGATYPVVLFPSTPSDGSQVVTVQSAWATGNARVRISWTTDAGVSDTSSQSFVIQ